MEKLNKAVSRVKDILNFLPEISNKHEREDSLYRFLNDILLEDIDTIYQSSETFKFGSFGTLYLPYVSFGAVNTKDLFGLDELMIFTYYLKMQKK